VIDPQPSEVFTMRIGKMVQAQPLATSLVTTKYFHVGDIIREGVDVPEDVFAVALREGWMELIEEFVSPENAEDVKPGSNKVVKPNSKKVKEDE